MISYDVKERLTSGLPIRAVRNRFPGLDVLDSDGVLEEGVDVVEANPRAAVFIEDIVQHHGLFVNRGQL